MKQKFTDLKIKHFSTRKKLLKMYLKRKLYSHENLVGDEHVQNCEAFVIDLERDHIDEYRWTMKNEDEFDLAFSMLRSLHANLFHMVPCCLVYYMVLVVY